MTLQAFIMISVLLTLLFWVIAALPQLGGALTLVASFAFATALWRAGRKGG